MTTLMSPYSIQIKELIKIKMLDISETTQIAHNNHTLNRVTKKLRDMETKIETMQYETEALKKLVNALIETKEEVSNE